MIVCVFMVVIEVPDECSTDSSDWCWQKLVQAGLAAMVRVTMCIAIGDCYLYMSELFPSVFRGICVASVAIIGRVGNVLAPLTADTLTSKDVSPYIAFGFASFVTLFVLIPAKYSSLYTLYFIS